MARKIEVQIVGDASQLKRALNDAGAHTEKFGSTVGTAAKGAGLALGAFGAVGAAAVIKTGFEFDNMKQQAQIAFTTMLKSGTKAQAFLGQLQRFAARTPFEFPGLVQSSQKLLAMGFSAKQVIPTLTSIGDAVAGLGGTPETLDRVTVALGQIQAKGKASSEEMMQLTEAGIPAWKYLAATLHTNVAGAMKLVTKGAVDSKTTIHAMTEGMNSDFAGMMDKQSHTFGGLFSTLKDTFSQVAGTVMKPFFEIATKGMQGLVDFMSGDTWNKVTAKISGAFSGLGQMVMPIISGLVDAFRNAVPGILALLQPWGAFIQDNLVPIFRNLMTVAETAIMRIAAVIAANRPAIETIFKNLGAIIQNLWTVAEPILRLLFTVVLPTAIRIAIPIVEAITGVIKGVTGAMVYVSQNIGAPINAVIGAFRTFKTTAGNIVDDIVGFFRHLPADIGNAVVRGAGAGWDLVKKGLAEIFGPVWKFVKEIFDIKSPSGVFQELGGNLVHGFVKGMKDNAGKIKDAIWPVFMKHFVPHLSNPGPPPQNVQDWLNALPQTGSRGAGVVSGPASYGGLVAQVVAALNWARAHGWHGSVTSGFRTYAEQAALYARYLAGGPLAAPPGHSSHEFGQAVDVTDVAAFARAMASAPPGARLNNYLGARDPVHFSVTGYAKGGIIQKPLLAFGEAGPEAIVPLSRWDDGWKKVKDSVDDGWKRVKQSNDDGWSKVSASGDKQAAATQLTAEQIQSVNATLFTFPSDFGQIVGTVQSLSDSGDANATDLGTAITDTSATVAALLQQISDAVAPLHDDLQALAGNFGSSSGSGRGSRSGSSGGSSSGSDGFTQLSMTADEAEIRGLSKPKRGGGSWVLVGSTGGGAHGGPARLARGGIVTGPTMALVGEAGPEAVIPLSKMRGGGGGGGDVYNFSFPNYVGNRSELADTVRRELLRMKGRNVNLGLS